MGLEILKKGQGVWTRLTAYVVGGMLVAYGAISLYGSINVPGEFRILPSDLPVIGAVTGFKVIALVVGLGGLLAMHWFLNKPRSVDLLIETEQEMRKVSWPTVPEVWNATLVVVAVTIVLSLAMSFFDLVLRHVLDLVW